MTRVRTWQLASTSAVFSTWHAQKKQNMNNWRREEEETNVQCLGKHKWRGKRQAPSGAHKSREETEKTDERRKHHAVGKASPASNPDTLTRVWLAKKVQAGAEEEYQHHESIPEEVLKLLKPMAVKVSFSEKSLLDLDYIIGPSQRSNAKIKTRHSMSWFGHSAQDRDFSGSSEVVEMSSHQASACFKHSTVIYVCVLEELALLALAFHRPAFEGGWCKQEKKFRLTATDSQKGRIKVLRKKRKGMRRSKWRKKKFISHQVDFQQVCFLFVVFYCTLELSEVVFSAVVRHHGQKHHISVIFNITHQHVYIFRKLGVLASA